MIQSQGQPRRRLTAPFFSDRLMMQRALAIVQAGLNNYSTALQSSFRSDLQAEYARLSGELSLYAKEGLDIMIKNEWFEQPPQAIDHKELAGV